MTLTEQWLDKSLDFLRQTVTENPYIPKTPLPKQALFLARTEIEGFFGGAAGGGKSIAVLMAALQFAQVPGYAALVLRKTFRDLAQPGGLMPISFAWLGGTDARWNGTDHSWAFPSGAVLKFGYLDAPLDVYQYQGSEYQFIAYDELTQFRERDYRYLFSRLRRTEETNIPLRVRATSNPGGVGHLWVKKRFIEADPSSGRFFIPSSIADNVHLDRKSYVQTLSHLSSVDRERLLRGDWSIMDSGGLFRREWFHQVVPEAPKGLVRVCRFWDLAATEPSPEKDPDYTAGVLIGYDRHGRWFILDVDRFQLSPLAVEQRVKMRAHSDPQDTLIRMEREGASSGKIAIDHYSRTVLFGRNFAGCEPIRSSARRANKEKVQMGSNVAWAGQLSSAAEAGNLVLVKGAWNEDFIEELVALPTGRYDDQAIAAASGMFVLSQGGKFEAESTGAQKVAGEWEGIRGQKGLIY